MDEKTGNVIDLAVLAREAAGSGLAGPLWSFSSADLNANVLRFAMGDGVPEHVNKEVDVIVLVVSGAAVVTLDGQDIAVRGGQMVVLPKGARRAIRAEGGDVVYVTVHRRRMGLMPARRQP
ncbi:MAG TPA: cupin domain-containing protein [Ktedonobacterales bacterium]|nr:cupin domain-containing protein [Ktedonobacterales bacterium]